MIEVISPCTLINPYWLRRWKVSFLLRIKGEVESNLQLYFSSAFTGPIGKLTGPSTPTIFLHPYRVKFLFSSSTLANGKLDLEDILHSSLQQFVRGKISWLFLFESYRKVGKETQSRPSLYFCFHPIKRQWEKSELFSLSVPSLPRAYQRGFGGQDTLFLQLLFLRLLSRIIL